MIGLVDVGSTELFVSTVGTGPALLLISGADDWTTVARMLADDFTVVTYERPRWSRGPGPTASTAQIDQLARSLIGPPQQADDAAGLLRVLHLAPAVVVGHGGGASVAYELVAHHPRLVRLAVVCEAQPSYVPDVDRLRASGVPMAVVGPGGDNGPAGRLTHPEAFVALLRDMVHDGGRS